MPGVGTAQSNSQESHESYHTHSRPRVHQERTKTILTRDRFNLVMDEELPRPVKHPGWGFRERVGSRDVQYAFQAFQVLPALWTAISQMHGDLPARLGVERSQRKVDNLIECDRVISHWRMVTQNPMPPESPVAPRSIGPAQR